MLAAMMNAPALGISQQEANAVASAAANVARHYDLGSTSQQTADWCQLALALGVVYGPRIMAMMPERKKRDRPAPSASPTPGFAPADAFSRNAAGGFDFTRAA
jgi:hypothetical protein